MRGEKIPETKTLDELVLHKKQGASSFYLKEGTEPVRVIRHKAVTADGNLLIEEVDEEHIKKHERTERNLLRTGDILVSLRLNFKVVLIPEELDGATFTGDFMGLTVDQKKIHPELLKAYLTQPAVIRYMEAQAGGAIAKSYPREALLRLPVTIPDKAVQDKLLTAVRKIAQHKRIAEQETAKLKELQEHILLEALGGTP